MSELTLCNYCTLEDIKRRHGKVELRRTADRWVDVLVQDGDDDWKVVASFAALPEGCAC